MPAVKRSTPHTLDLTEMLDWLADSERALVCFASSTREPKSLEIMAGRSIYRVKHGQDVVYFGPHPAEAVEAYNSIR